MMTARGHLAHRDRRISQAQRHLSLAYRYLVDALRSDGWVPSIDQIGAMNLARAADDANGTIRNLDHAVAWARQKRRDYNRAVAQERSAP
jgi:hypothetical protein